MDCLAHRGLPAPALDLPAFGLMKELRSSFRLAGQDRIADWAWASSTGLTQ